MIQTKIQPNNTTFDVKLQNDQESSSRKYSHIDYQTRLKLINMVIEQGFAISKASQILNIKLSTGKFIIASYKKKGKVMKKKGQIERQKIIKQKEEAVKQAQQQILNKFMMLPYSYLYYYPQ